MKHPYTMPRLDIIALTPPSINPRTVMDAHFPEGYRIAEAVFYTKEGNLKNQATMDEIDWEKMNTVAHEAAVANENEHPDSSIERDTLIAIRETVHKRPHMFIDKDGTWYSGDMEFSAKESRAKLIKAWETAIQNASPDDLFTHWST
jgi:hypothetical protein